MDLSLLEAAVLSKLLAGAHPALRSLRAQLGGLSVARRELSGVGFFTEFVVRADACPTLRSRSLRWGDVHAMILGLRHGAGFLLYVDDGRISMLEGYAYGEPWPTAIEGFVLWYSNEDRTEALAKLGSTP